MKGLGLSCVSCREPKKLSRLKDSTLKKAAGGEGLAGSNWVPPEPYYDKLPASTGLGRTQEDLAGNP